MAKSRFFISFCDNIDGDTMINTRRIKEIREDHDISQIKMANILNVKRSTYSMWEVGLSVMPLDILWQFSKYFNLDIDYVLGLSNERKNNSINEFNYLTIGENIKKLRVENNLSQIELAKKINVTQACIVRWEKGITKITISNIYQLSKIFNVYITDLCKEKAKPKISV